jgi:uncharacterized protein YkwD
VAAFELDSPVRAVKSAVRRQIPGKPIWGMLLGAAAAAGVSIGLASAISVGIDDPAPFPNAKAAPPPPPALLEAAQSEAEPAFLAEAQPARTDSAGRPLKGLNVIWAWGLAAAVPPESPPPSTEANPITGPDISPIVSDPAPVAPAPVNEAPTMQTAPIVQPEPTPEPAPVVQPEPAPAPAPAPNFYLPPAIGGDATMEARLLAGINAERAAAGLAPYVTDATLVTIARTRSQQMVDQGYFGHTDPNGQFMYTALLEYYGIGYAWAGENLAMNNYGAGESPDRALVSLMNSATHRANILADDFTSIGVGVVFHSDGRWFYTMIFTS